MDQIMAQPSCRSPYVSDRVHLAINLIGALGPSLHAAGLRGPRRTPAARRSPPRMGTESSFLPSAYRTNSTARFGQGAYSALQLAGSGSPCCRTYKLHGVAIMSASHASGLPSILVWREQSSVVNAPALQLSIKAPSWACVISPATAAHVALRVQSTSTVSRHRSGTEFVGAVESDEHPASATKMNQVCLMSLLLLSSSAWPRVVPLPSRPLGSKPPVDTVDTLLSHAPPGVTSEIHSPK